jgi:acetyl-CoA acyltransferase 1
LHATNALRAVVITMAVRSPLCKARKGGYKDMRCVGHPLRFPTLDLAHSSDELLTAFFKAIIPKMGCDPALVEDITVGTVLGNAQAYEARASMLAAGFRALSKRGVKANSYRA